MSVLQVAASQYLAALIIGFVNSATIQPVIAIERTVFHREKAAGRALASDPSCICLYCITPWQDGREAR